MACAGNKSTRGPSVVQTVLRRLAWRVAIGLAVLYVVGVLAGYAWLRFGRGLDQIAMSDVALFRVAAVRRGMAVAHFAQAQAEWDKKNFQAAYILFSTAVAQDPENLPGRLNAVRFMRALGVGNLAASLLEDGLARAPDNQELMEQTFDLLLATDREHHALELLHQQYGAGPGGPHGLALQTYELKATAATDGAKAARLLLEKHPGLLQYPPAAPVVARIQWESAERLKAIEVMERRVATPEAVFADFAQLAAWQAAGGMITDAVATAERSCARFPSEIAATVLRIEMHAAASPTGLAPAEIAAYLREYQGRPEALGDLAALAGRKGWVDIARDLYIFGAGRLTDLTPLALAYSDALAMNSRYPEVREILGQLDAQLPDTALAAQVQLRQRQIITAGALGETDNVREYARRLADILHGEPQAIEACRRVFQRLGIAAAVAELSSRSLSGTAGSRK